MYTDVYSLTQVCLDLQVFGCSATPCPLGVSVQATLWQIIFEVAWRRTKKLGQNEAVVFVQNKFRDLELFVSLKLFFTDFSMLFNCLPIHWFFHICLHDFSRRLFQRVCVFPCFSSPKSPPFTGRESRNTASQLLGAWAAALLRQCRGIGRRTRSTLVGGSALDQTLGNLSSSASRAWSFIMFYINILFY